MADNELDICESCNHVRGVHRLPSGVCIQPADPNNPSPDNPMGMPCLCPAFIEPPLAA